MIGLEFRDEGLNSAIRSLMGQIDNPRSLLTNYGEYLVLSKRDLFDRETDPTGTAWAPLAQATVRAKRRRGSSNPEKILYQFGTLSQTLTYQLIGNDNLLFGSPLEIGIYHQYGTKTMPARKFLDLSPADLAEFDRQAEAYLQF
jgi:phage virion morphogenesis protein